jgi:hypothetical protein
MPGSRDSAEVERTYLLVRPTARSRHAPRSCGRRARRTSASGAPRPRRGRAAEAAFAGALRPDDGRAAPRKARRGESRGDFMWRCARRLRDAVRIRHQDGARRVRRAPGASASARSNSASTSSSGSPMSSSGSAVRLATGWPISPRAPRRCRHRRRGWRAAARRGERCRGGAALAAALGADRRWSVAALAAGTLPASSSCCSSGRPVAGLDARGRRSRRRPRTHRRARRRPSSSARVLQA